MSLGTKVSLFGGSSITTLSSSGAGSGGGYGGTLLGGSGGSSLFGGYGYGQGFGTSGLFGYGSSSSSGAGGLGTTTPTAPQVGPQGVDIAKQVAEDSVAGYGFLASDFTVSDASAVDSMQVTSLPANGTLELSSVAVALNQIIDSDDFGNLAYIPDADFDGVETFTIAMSTDGTDYDSTPSNVQITVLASDDDAPSVAAVPTVAVAEGETASNLGSLIVASYTDPDTNDTLDQVLINAVPTMGTLSYTSGAGGVITLAGAATISAAEAATLVFTADADNGAGESAATTDTFTFDLVDSSGLTSATAGTVNIQINDGNDAPVMAATDSYSVNENVTAIDAVVNPATDNETPDTLVYSITGTDAALFNVDAANGDLSFKAAPDYEDAKDSNKDNIYRLNLVATDDGGETAKQAVDVEVNDESSNLAISAATVSVDEGTTFALTVGAATNNDPIGDVTYSIAGGADSALFTIDDETGVLSFISAPDFEDDLSAGSTNSYVVDIAASIDDGDDGAVSTDTQTMTVDITDLDDEKPSFITAASGADALSANNVSTAEGALSFEVEELANAVSAIEILDINFGDGEDGATSDTGISYSMSSSAGTSNLTITAASGKISLGAGLDLDFETRSSITLTVTAEDASGATAKTTVDVTVTDVDEDPEYTAPSNILSVDSDQDYDIGDDISDAFEDPESTEMTFVVSAPTAAGSSSATTAGVLQYDLGGVNNATVTIAAGSSATGLTASEVASLVYYGPESDIAHGTAVTTDSITESLTISIAVTAADTADNTAAATFDIVVVDQVIS